MDSERVRRPRESRGDRFPAPVQRRSLQTASATSRRSPKNRPPGRWFRGPPMSAASGFGMKWDMGWMHDTLKYFSHDPDPPQVSSQRADVPHALRVHENFVLPLSHDEVVHGKGSLIGKMPGDDGRSSPTCGCCSRTCTRSRQKSCCSWAASSASGRSGRTTSSLDWHLLQYDSHRQLQRWVADLNRDVSRRACASRTRLRSGRIRMDRRQRFRAKHAELHAQVARRSEIIVAVFNFTPVRGTTIGSACPARLLAES